jgi:PleD family two-component response regulator
VQTVSLGVAALVPESGEGSIHLMRLADQALYSAKLSGRNKVACAGNTQAEFESEQREIAAG